MLKLMGMKRSFRPAGYPFGLFLLIVFSFFMTSCGREPENLNILLISIDTLRADHMSCYGYERKTTPNIDELARRGVLFENATVNWPKTTPSMASMLTGTYGRTSGMIGGCRMKLPLELDTLAEVMKRKGFVTGAVVNNANLGKEFQFDQGFDALVEMWRKPPPVSCVNVTDEALAWLERNTDKKFFLWVHYLAPHAAYEPAEPYKTMFIDDQIYENFADLNLPVKSSFQNAIHKSKAFIKPHTNHAYYVSQYDGEIAYVDSQVKRIADFLKKRKLDSRTLLIITSDHGEEMGEHELYYEHGFNAYEATMHVPLILIYPGQIPAGRRIRDQLVLVDLFPTITDYAGIGAPEQLEGRSLRPVIKGRSRSTEPVFSEGTNFSFT